VILAWTPATAIWNSGITGLQ